MMWTAKLRQSSLWRLQRPGQVPSGSQKDERSPSNTTVGADLFCSLRQKVLYTDETSIWCSGVSFSSTAARTSKATRPPGWAARSPADPNWQRAVLADLGLPESNHFCQPTRETAKGLQWGDPAGLARTGRRHRRAAANHYSASSLNLPPTQIPPSSTESEPI